MPNLNKLNQIPPFEAGSYTVDEFCGRHRMSRAHLYGLWKKGEGPRFVKIGSNTRITPQAEADWLRALETDSVA